MRRSVALLLAGCLLGTLIGATGAPADIAGSALRLAKKAQRTAKSAQRSAKKANSAVVKGARVDRGVVTYTVPPRVTVGPLRSRCPGDFPLGISSELPDGLRLVGEERLADGFSYTLQNETAGTLSAKITVDCLIGVDANNDPASFGDNE